MSRTRSAPSSLRTFRAPISAANGRPARLFGSPRADLGRVGLRLFEWLARRRQLDRDGGLYARVAAAVCGDVGRVLQFRRLFVLRAPCRPDGRNWNRRCGGGRCSCDFRRIDGRHLLESVDLVAGDSLEQFARLDRRTRGRRGHEGGTRLDRVERSWPDRRGDCFFPVARIFACADARAWRRLGICPHNASGRGQYLPFATIRLRIALLAGTRRQ